MIDKKIIKLMHYIKLNDIPIDTNPHTIKYRHMGATITDAVLQAGINYEHVVVPRIKHLIDSYSKYTMTYEFFILISKYSLPFLINWSDNIKLERIDKLLTLLLSENVQTEKELSTWINLSYNIDKLLSIKGIGKKTVDYLNILVGNPTVAVDRHMYNFLKLADISFTSYDDAKLIFIKLANVLNITEYNLDKSIWKYMATSQLQTISLF